MSAAGGNKLNISVGFRE